MEIEWLPVVVLFGSLLVVMLLGVPVAFTLGGLFIVLGLAMWNTSGLYTAAYSVWTNMNSLLLIAIPLFLLMGNLLFYSGIADELFDMIHLWSGRLRGTLALATVGVCVVYGAMTGIVGAAVTSMALIALPSMLKRGYNKMLAVGIIAPAGSLAMLIPPSVAMIIYAQITGESVGGMFAAGLMVGLLLAALFAGYILIRSALDPKWAPAYQSAERISFRTKFLASRALIFPVLIVIVVLGAIVSGVATPTEAAALGSLACIVAIFLRKRLTWPNLKKSCESTLSATGMIMWILIAATAFRTLWIALGAQHFMIGLLTTLPVSRWFILGILYLILIVLGMLIDPITIILICGPVFLPVAKALGFDSLWFSIQFMSLVTLGFVTPPYGASLFYLKAVAPQDVSMTDIFRSTVPWVIIWVVQIFVVTLFPQIATWLPNLWLGQK